MVLRRVVPSALLNNSRVELEGRSDESLPSGQVYVSPTSGKVYDGSRGDTLAQLPPDATEVKRTTWWIRLPWKKGEGKNPSQSFSQNVGTEESRRHWYDSTEGTQRLRLELMEMNRYFPDFDLYLNDNDAMLWTGEIEGIGEVQIRYPENYPLQKFSTLLISQSESLNQELTTFLSQFPAITPTGSLIVAMRLVLKRRKEKVEPVVRKPPGPDETSSRDNSDAEAQG